MFMCFRSNSPSGPLGPDGLDSGRRSRTPDRHSRYTGRYRSPTPGYHYPLSGPGTARGRPDMDGDATMRDVGQEEWLLKRAYESGRSDERRRLQRIMMDALELNVENGKESIGENLIQL